MIEILCRIRANIISGENWVRVEQYSPRKVVLYAHGARHNLLSVCMVSCSSDGQGESPLGHSDTGRIGIQQSTRVIVSSSITANSVAASSANQRQITYPLSALVTAYLDLSSRCYLFSAPNASSLNAKCMLLPLIHRTCNPQLICRECTLYACALACCRFDSLSIGRKIIVA